MFRRIWQWLKRLFRQLFVKSGRRRSSGKLQGTVSVPLSDPDYEFLFNQLLEGVAHGWHEGRIVKFFQNLEERGKPKLWVAWLERFGDKVLASAAPNQQLALLMMRLGEKIQGVHSVNQIGETSYRIGRQLLNQATVREIWEYDGPDGEHLTPQEIQEEPAPTSPPSSAQPRTVTLEELLVMLQQSPELRQEMARQFGIESTEPETIVQAVRQQIEQKQNVSPEEQVQAWFNLGLQQADAGDLPSAIASWDQALTLDPNLTQAWHNRGSALGGLGRLEEAINSFDRALQLKPDDYQAWDDRGTALYSLNRKEEALASWDKSLEFNPNYYLAWYHRGQVLAELGNLEESVRSYQQALTLNPDFQPVKDQLTLLQNQVANFPDDAESNPE